jgi:hypothetical protein
LRLHNIFGYYDPKNKYMHDCEKSVAPHKVGLDEQLPLSVLEEYGGRHHQDLYRTVPLPPTLKIYDQDIHFVDTRQAGYNIGDLLNMPYLSHQWPQSKGSPLMYEVGRVCPNSILNIYCHDKPPEELVPNLPRLIRSVETYMKRYKLLFVQFKPLLKLVRHKDTLCVHVRSGDQQVSSEYIKTIERLSHKRAVQKFIFHRKSEK